MTNTEDTGAAGSWRRRTLLRATAAAGGVLALGSVGQGGRARAVPTAADTSAFGTTVTSRLERAGDGDEYTFQPDGSSPGRMVVSLTSTTDGDFDLYLTRDGRPPRPGDSDVRSVSGDTSEEIAIDADRVSEHSEFGVLVHSYKGSGEYELSVEQHRDGVVDDGRDEGDQFNERPIAQMTALDPAYVVGDRIGFDGSISTDPYSDADSELSYRWQFGDGATNYGPTAWHTYDDPGEYVVTLTVTDERGATDVTAERVTVTDGRPVADIEIVTDELREGQPVVFDGSDSYAPDGEITTYHWGRVDEGKIVDGDGPLLTDEGCCPGYRSRLSLIVEDHHGRLSDPATVHPDPLPAEDDGWLPF